MNFYTRTLYFFILLTLFLSFFACYDDIDPETQRSCLKSCSGEYKNCRDTCDETFFPETDEGSSCYFKCRDKNSSCTGNCDSNFLAE